MFLLMMIATLAIVYMSKRPFIEIDAEGNTTLAEWRSEKLNKELEELDEAEQYVLLAKKSGFFPCFNYKSSTTIFLNRNERWKYGYTTKGEQGRYS